jgi:hypothetical protein
MELYMGSSPRLIVSFAVVLFSLLRTQDGSAAERDRTFALVVTNNRSTTLELPDLQYADDDGARYYRLFRSVADEKDVVLLTTFDRSSAASYPDLVDLAHPPTLAGVQAAVHQLATAAEIARKEGHKTTFYFVYAGHGDVADGRGVIDLEDGEIDGQFIENAILEKIPANTKHVLLDSCNSFFVMNPRKPGGRRWATPKDMALGFAKRHPEVGLFLSTNTDAEVFEWSEVESGVFSHEVRSGLSGAADVDGDGNVSYAELAGFVDQANARITRDILRPHIYYRGPNNESATALFSPARADGRRLVLSENATRLWIKNESGERLLDVHKEAGPMTLVLPGEATQPISIYVETAPLSKSDRPTVDERQAPPGDAEIHLSELRSDKPVRQTRGDRLFASLFATPYGPVAYRTFLSASASEPEPVYGLSDKDVTRMHNYISAMADGDRERRWLSGGILVGLGAGNLVGAAVGYSDSPRWKGAGGRGGAIAAAVVGSALLGTGITLLCLKTPGQRAFETFEHEMATEPNRSIALAKTDQALEDLARSDRRGRAITFWVLEGIGALYATAVTAGLLYPEQGEAKLQPSNAAAIYVLSASFIGAGFAFRNLLEPQTERVLKLYRSDPDLKVRFGVAPTPSGGVVGLSGSF